MPLPVEDRLAILHLVGRSSQATDAGDGDAVAACYTADGVYDVGSWGRYEGRGAIASFIISAE